MEATPGTTRLAATTVNTRPYPRHLTLSRKTRVGDVDVENTVTIEMVVGESSLAAGLRAWDILDLAEKK